MNYEKLSIQELKTIAKERGVKNYYAFRKHELISILSSDDDRSAAPDLEEEQTAEPTERKQAKKPAEPKAVKKQAKAPAEPEVMRPAEEPAEAEEEPVMRRPAEAEAEAAVRRPAEAEEEHVMRRPAENEAEPSMMRPAERRQPDYRPARQSYSSYSSDRQDRPVRQTYQSYSSDRPERPIRQSYSSYSSDRQERPVRPSYSPEGRQYSSDGRQYSSDNRQYSQDNRQYSSDNRQYSSDNRQYSSDTRQYSQESRPQYSAPSRPVEGRITSTGRITPEERAALDPALSPEIESLDSGETKTGIFESVEGQDYGFIRCDNFLPGTNDVYVAPAQIRKFNLKTGDIIVGNTKVRSATEKFSALLYIKSVNGFHPSEAAQRPKFEDLTPIFPNERLHLETPGCSPALRIVDLLSPIGKGQRGMIVSQPKAGKTTLLKELAGAITKNYPKMHVIILLIDERPEEVTDMKESIKGENVEVIYSTFDELPDNHKRVSEMVIERARRLVEHKQDVVILLDSITRLARAYNLTCQTSGRTLSGGLDPAALHMPKKFFGAARNMREGGSLTIIATALVETGSRMDDVVFEEFKGTGNMELVLNRNLSERRIFPAIDLPKSSTRREDLLLSREESEANTIIRRAFSSSKSEEMVEKMINLFYQTRSNSELIDVVRKTKLQ